VLDSEISDESYGLSPEASRESSGRLSGDEFTAMRKSLWDVNNL
jgi:hypothetical protein